MEWNQRAYDKMVKKAKSIYNQAQGSWVDFVIYLIEVEDSGVWKHPNYSGFGDFLGVEFPAAFGMTKYINARKAINTYGANFMRKLGIECSHTITRDAIITDEQHIKKLREMCEAHFSNNGVMPAIYTVNKFVKKIVPIENGTTRLIEQRKRTRELEKELSKLKTENKEFLKAVIRAEKEAEKLERKATRTDSKVSNYAELQNENKELKAENARLRKELKASKMEIEKLERKLQKYERSGGSKNTGTSRSEENYTEN